VDSFPLYTQAIRFEVSIGLDGVTPAPILPQPPYGPLIDADGADISFDSDTGELVVRVDRLGLVNLTGGDGVDGDRADRFVKSIRVYGPNPPFNQSNVGVFFGGDGLGPDERRIELAIPLTANGIYSTNCIFVPQSGRLYLNGMTGVAGSPVIVRIGLWQPKSVADLVAAQRACCCMAGCVDEDGNPCFVEAIYTAEACARTIETVDPDTVIQNSGANVITVTGSGFVDGDSWAIVNADEPAEIEITNINVVSETEVELTIEVPFDVFVGSYDVVVAAELGGSECTATLEDGLTVIPE
jgi:hypothetical protein